MNAKQIFLMILAFIWVALLAFFIMRWIKPSTVSHKTVEVLVATTEITPEKPISEKNVSWVKISASKVQPEDIQKGPNVLESYIGRKTLINVPAKQVLKKNYFPSVQTGRLAQLISPGMYAMTVALNKNANESMFILPGDKVDVFLTRTLTTQNATAKNSESMTQVLLANIRVLAVNELMINGVAVPTAKSQAAGQKTLTLELNAEEAERLSLGTSIGSLSFSLHNPSNVPSVITEPFSSKHLNPRKEPPIVEYHGEKMIYKTDF